MTSPTIPTSPAATADLDQDPAPGRRESPARRRVLETATGLFYAEGIRSVGIDRIIAEAGVAKATFYHHFPTKDELVKAYLEAVLRGQQAATAQVRREDPIGTVLAVFDVIGDIGCGPDFRGCPFVNAAVEYPDPAHPVRDVVRAHRVWFRGVLADLLANAGHADAERTAGMLMIVRDGIVVSSNLDDAESVRAVVRDAVTRVLAAQ